jgi:hypothetical protein
MTTIAANLTEMAADRRMVGGGPMVSSRKIVRIKDSLYGGAGDGEAIEMFYAWALSGFAKKERPVWGADNVPEFCILELSVNGLRMWGARLAPIPIDEDFWAIGSGSMSAQAAMYCGKSPKQAVEIAALYDENTGHGTQVERLKK